MAKMAEMLRFQKRGESPSLSQARLSLTGHERLFRSEPPRKGRGVSKSAQSEYRTDRKTAPFFGTFRHPVVGSITVWNGLPIINNGNGGLQRLVRQSAAGEWLS